MRKGIILLAIALAAAAAWGYKVYTDNGKAVRHEESQIPWTMRFNELGTPDCANEWAQFNAAMNTWSNVRCQYYRNARGANNTTLSVGRDGINLVVFYEPAYQAYGQPAWTAQGWPASAIAVNSFWFENAGAYYRVVENDQAFNGYNYTWSDSGAAGKMDVQNIAAHELGHNLVLDDLYAAAHADKTMYGYAAAGETKKRSLHADDIAGIRFLYGTPGITLDSFTARAAAGAVVLTWSAREDGRHAGYNIYRRRDDGAAAYEKLNTALVAGRSPYRWRDEDVAAGRGYQYLLEAVDLSGGTERYGPVRVTTGGGKGAFSLAACYPNPAHERVTIKYALAGDGAVRLAVYDLSGRKVTVLAEGAAKAGEHEIAWNLTTADGCRVAPGVYIYRLEAGGATAARRMVITR